MIADLLLKVEPVLSPVVAWGTLAVVVAIVVTLGAVGVWVFAIEAIDDYRHDRW